ncbi:MAG: universal stress protein [Pirellulales bacterium]
MTTNRILFATDYSKASEDALRVASSLARDTGAILVVLHVSKLEEQPEGELLEGTPEPPQQDWDRLHQVQPDGGQIPCEYRLVRFKPPGEAQIIVDVAKEEGVEMIVIGTHGRTGLSRLIAGSVAEEVIRHANCPVVAVRQTSPEYEPTLNIQG